MGDDESVVGTDPEKLASVDTPKRKRDRSTIEFPYSDLDSAIELARTIHDRAGTACDTRQLAGWMDKSVTGGTFRSWLSAARIFGLVETERGQVSLTPVGRQIIDAQKEKAAKITAFLNVPLFYAMYEQFHGYALPPAAAIERQMAELGVAGKQTERARQTFMKSAQSAGFIDPQTGRFVKPGPGATPTEEPESPESKTPKGGDGDGGGAGHHPFIQGLLQTLPEPDQEWPLENQVTWLETAAHIFGLIYKREGKIRIEAEPVSSQKNRPPETNQSDRGS